MWQIEVYFNMRWHPLGGSYKEKGEAEWRIAQWKAANLCHKDPFRVVPMPVLDRKTERDEATVMLTETPTVQ